MKLTKLQSNILESEGHLLVTGGPGSGKTTISIIKAAKIAQENLQLSQKILFLSFARATVSRVSEAIHHEQKICSEQKKLIDVDTYHSFFWSILKTHGYLLGLPKKLKILTPPSESVALSAVRAMFPSKNLTDVQINKKKNAERKEQRRLAQIDGKVCFDLYAPYVYEILQKSKRICQLISDRYPTIVLDEFQDTNDSQWNIMRELGKHCNIIALADPEQRIYEWAGANSMRLIHFRDAFNPIEINLGCENHRSKGTEIRNFADDILSGQFNKNTYTGIEVSYFQSNPIQAMSALITAIYKARKRVFEQCGEGWSLAVLVPTKKMVRDVSEALNNPPIQKLSRVPHTAAIELDGAILGAEIIAFLMQRTNSNDSFNKFVRLVCNYFRGKGGSAPTKTALSKAEKIAKGCDKLNEAILKNKPVTKNSIISKMHDVYTQACNAELSGSPSHDWMRIRNILKKGTCKQLHNIDEDLKNLRILQKGEQLRNELSQDWINNACYSNALEIVRKTFINIHFETKTKPESGVIIMNMHKAKGKQFDEVIIFEGWPKKQRGQIVGNPDRIVRGNFSGNADEQARQNFRVSITRSKLQTSILTPQDNPCVLLLPYLSDN